ncbi:hypothetical protein V6N13_033177 [Hibiscus sabdariffa]|uniref:Uncharacterized protein n=1 Tax=Hibiscus sabdariffa TaxID=183260 RepID=A0ABR2FB68_9ROSI
MLLTVTKYAISDMVSGKFVAEWKSLSRRFGRVLARFPRPIIGTCWLLLLRLQTVLKHQYMCGIEDLTRNPQSIRTDLLQNHHGKCYRKHEQKGFDPIFDARMSDHRGKLFTGYNADQPSKEDERIKNDK